MTLTPFKDDERKANPRAAMVRVEIRDAQGYANQRRHDMRIGAQPAYVNPDPPELNHVFIQPLAEIAKSGESEAARVSASVAILDRAYGRPGQAVEITDDRPVMPSVIEIRAA